MNFETMKQEANVAAWLTFKNLVTRQEIQDSMASRPLVIHQKHFHLLHMLLSTLWQFKWSMLANFKCAW